jgi:hypothetical protein
MQPDSEFDGIWIPSEGSKAVHGCQHGPDVIERMVEAAGFGIMLANVLKGSIAELAVHDPEKITPFTAQYVVHKLSLRFFVPPPSAGPKRA